MKAKETLQDLYDKLLESCSQLQRECDDRRAYSAELENTVFDLRTELSKKDTNANPGYADKEAVKKAFMRTLYADLVSQLLQELRYAMTAVQNAESAIHNSLTEAYTEAIAVENIKKQS